MKTMNKPLAWLMAAVLSLALVAPAGAETAAARTGKVVRIKGDARYSTGKKIWEPLKVGTVLKSGSIVQTAKDAFVDIVVNEEENAAAVTLVQPKAGAAAPASAGAGGGGAATPSPDQDVIRVLDDSYLVFDSMSAKTTGSGNVTETLLDLKKGSIFGSVKKQAAASRFEVKIPNGVAGIRGTIFLITASGNVSCLTGSVVAAFTDSSGGVATQVVGGGSQLNTSTGQISPIPAAASSSMNAMSANCNYEESKDKGKGKGKGHGHHHNDGHVSKHKP